MDMKSMEVEKENQAPSRIMVSEKVNRNFMLMHIFVNDRIMVI